MEISTRIRLHNAVEREQSRMTSIRCETAVAGSALAGGLSRARRASSLSEDVMDAANAALLTAASEARVADQLTQ